MTPPEKRVKQEITAGFIVYRRTPEGPKFLVLYHRGDYWNFPKGHIESEEKSLTAAIRETKEETGLASRDLRILDGFKAYERFYFKRSGQGIFKIVILYLAETRNPRVLVSREHQGYGWFLYRDAKQILGKYRDSVRPLEKAYEFLHSKSPHGHGTHPARHDAHVPGSRA